MTGRTCPVHGEYSESGVCRWCEPKPATFLDVAQSSPNARLMPVIEPTPWAGGRQVPAEEIADAIRERRFDEPVSLPGLKGLWQEPDRIEVNEAGVPTYTFILTEQTADEYRWRLEWTAPELARVCNVDEALAVGKASIFDAMVEGWVRIVRARLQDDMVEARCLTFDATRCSPRLDAQHAALRWERVARRWGSKHPTMLDLAKGWGLFVVEAMREHVEKLARTNPFLQDKPWESKPLKTIYEGHKMDPDGELAFDDHCASCVRLAREGRWP